MKIAKVIFGSILVIVGVVWGWLQSWQLEFNAWYNWVWLICIITGSLALVQGIVEMLYAFGIALIAVGLLWGNSMDWVHAELTEHYSEWSWIWLIAVGASILIFRLMADLLSEKKRFQWRKDNVIDEHVCPNGSEWDDKVNACVYREKNES